MPPGLRRAQRRFDEVPLYDSTGSRLKLVPRPPEQPFEVEPSPLIEAILKYLETAR
ncbi:MAG: hypothetical protein IT380_09565 [Myxococcales bacterium]|nr:hypothetical protein [Myxococcales bacterium]